MKAGQYNRRIAIPRPVQTRLSSGGIQTWWELVQERWAAIRPVGGAEYFAADQVKSQTITRFIIRHEEQLLPTYRILTQARAYAIEALLNVGGLDQELEIVAIGDPEAPPHFQYADIAKGAGGVSRTARLSWRTDAYASTQIRYRKIGAPAWTEMTELDTAEGIFEHAMQTGILDLASNYEGQIRSRNQEGWTPGWAGALTWGISETGVYLPDGYEDLPIIEIQPVATPAATSCGIGWGTDKECYHRVRYRKAGMEDWTTTAWTPGKSELASVVLSPLESEQTIYEYQVESCLVGDESKSTGWHPDDDWLMFTTLCSTITYSGFQVAKPDGSTIRFNWNTAKVAGYDEAQYKKSGGSWTPCGPTHRGYNLTHYQTHSFKWEGSDGVYYFQVRNRNKCGTLGAWSAQQQFSISGGVPGMG